MPPSRNKFKYQYVNIHDRFQIFIMYFHQNHEEVPVKQLHISVLVLIVTTFFARYAPIVTITETDHERRVYESLCCMHHSEQANI